jgi:hypothetical protein
MGWQDRAGDRRAGPRFDVVGRLPGSIVTGLSLRVLNISRGGAFVESQWPLVVGAAHQVRLECAVEQNAVAVVVRRVEFKPDRDPPYLIALEFAAPPDRLYEQIDRLSG